MSFTVNIIPSGHTFSANKDESILDAAERQGIVLPYGCRNGLCGSCAGTLTAGAVSYPEGMEESLQERPDNQCLTCQASAASDLTLQIHEVESAQELEVKTLPCKVTVIERLCHDVMRVCLQLPEDQRLQFLAGQYLDFLLEDGRRRAFSIANAPHDDDQIELHIRHVPGGEFTEYVFSEMQLGSVQSIQAPMGGFYLREDSQRPIVMMAGGTGFAPLKGIIEHALHIGLSNPIHLYWGVRQSRDLYLAEIPKYWASAHRHFQFTPVLSEADDDWTGRRGFVHEAVVEDYPDMSRFDLYMSGPPPMVYAGKDAFLDAGLDEAHMYSDVFEWAKDNPNK